MLLSQLDVLSHNEYIWNSTFLTCREVTTPLMPLQRRLAAIVLVAMGVATLSQASKKVEVIGDQVSSLRPVFLPNGVPVILFSTSGNGISKRLLISRFEAPLFSTTRWQMQFTDLVCRAAIGNATSIYGEMLGRYGIFYAVRIMWNRAFRKMMFFTFNVSIIRGFDYTCSRDHTS